MAAVTDREIVEHGDALVELVTEAGPRAQVMLGLWCLERLRLAYRRCSLGREWAKPDLYGELADLAWASVGHGQHTAELPDVVRRARQLLVPLDVRPYGVLTGTARIAAQHGADYLDRLAAGVVNPRTVLNGVDSVLDGLIDELEGYDRFGALMRREMADQRQIAERCASESVELAELRDAAASWPQLDELLDANAASLA